MAAAPRTRYADGSGVEIAYQVLGEGPVDLLLCTGGTTPIGCVDEEPAMARFHRRLASFGRLIRFDRRGIGQSDRGTPSSPPTAEDWAQDAVAVLNAAGSERAVVIAPWVASRDGFVLAATRPERVRSLVVLDGFARLAWAPDYPHGLRPRVVDQVRQMGADPDAVDRGYDLLAVIAPSVADDPAFRAWWDRSGNLGATPAMARAIQYEIMEIDVRSLLPAVGVPTLLVQHTGGQFGDPGRGRYLAANLADARLVELPGSDYLYWVGDTAPVLDEIEEFVTGSRGGAGAERVLTTVLFTDIVGSTERAGRMGDERWRALLDRHDQVVRTELDRFRGREVKTMGDGFVATFESPRRAIECALALRDALAPLEVGVRAGIHTGEIEVRGDDVAGMAVHIGARVSARAGAGEVLVSSTVKELVVGSSVAFDDRGEFELKGVPGVWRLFAVAR
jgi:class 3 adenylate cyclase